MWSDGRVVERLLGKAECCVCGLVSHAQLPSAAEVEAYFAAGYALYAHAPGGAAESARQRAYAEWIAGWLGPSPAGTGLEAGCGNGSLLLELQALRPGWDLGGLEPSSDAASQARRAGLRVRSGTAAAAPEQGDQHDVVFAVNVIEHCPDPVAFLRSLAAAARPEGRILIVCPDGARRSTELLMFDHWFTFTDTAIALLAERANLRVTDTQRAPGRIGPFRIHVLAREGRTQSLAPSPAGAARAAYLEAWGRLDAELCARIGNDAPSCFGTGETALLLRAYAPRAWSRIGSFVVDAPETTSFCGAPVVGLAAWRPEPLLLAVRPRDQAGLAERLGDLAPRVVRWDDLIGGE